MSRLVAGLALLTTAHASTQCWTGIAGANLGPSCDKTQLYKASEYNTPNCYGRAISKKCVENNKHVGHGDGCPDNDDLNSCTSYQSSDGSKRSAEESFDGTDKHCRWMPELNTSQKKDECEIDDGCIFYADRGMRTEGISEGSCDGSEIAQMKQSNWGKMLGKDCEQRVKFGCFENNAHMGEKDSCKKQTVQDVCLAQVDDCSEGVCSGTASAGKVCGERTSEGECAPEGGATGCSWKKQCCQWIAKPTSEQEACLLNGKGTLDGVCTYNDGAGPPSKDIVGAGFEYGLFRKDDKFNGHCALIASFRNGKGSAVALGSDKADLVGTACKGAASWKNIAEHIGHTSATVDEYCANFVPDTSAMSAFKQLSPSYIITKAKQGQFGAVFPGLRELLFIVTAKPEYGECLFTSELGKFGAGVCTCDTAECNNQAALELIVDGDTGPMRLLQFLDGSLSRLKDGVNGIVSGLLDAEGKINPANVGSVTEANVDTIMKLDGMSSKTNKDELWGLVQDYQALLKVVADYKKKLVEDETYKALEIDTAKVKEANDAAGCLLYGDDGIPNTFCLEGLSEDRQIAVSEVTGIAIGNFKAATDKAAAPSGSVTSAQVDGVASGVEKIASLGLLLLLATLGASLLHV